MLPFDLFIAMLGGNIPPPFKNAVDPPVIGIPDFEVDPLSTDAAAPTGGGSLSAVRAGGGSLSGVLLSGCALTDGCAEIRSPPAGCICPGPGDVGPKGLGGGDAGVDGGRPMLNSVGRPCGGSVGRPILDAKAIRRAAGDISSVACAAGFWSNTKPGGGPQFGCPKTPVRMQCVLEKFTNS
jgi:hypothetical protein